MIEQKKKIYFIEQTKNIEGSYVEIDTVRVEADKDEAIQEFHQLVNKSSKKSFGYTLNEYEIKAEPSFFQKLINSWRRLPAEFYKRMQIVNFQLIAEYQG